MASSASILQENFSSANQENLLISGFESFRFETKPKWRFLSGLIALAIKFWIMNS